VHSNEAAFTFDSLGSREAASANAVRDTTRREEELQSLPLGDSSAIPGTTLSVRSATWGDSGEVKVILSRGGGSTREIYTTGVQELPYGCMAMQFSIPALRSLSARGYSLIAVTERHLYVDDCIADNVEDTARTTFLDAARDFRSVLTVETAVFEVVSKSAPTCEGGGECWDTDTTSQWQTAYSLDSLGLHMYLRDRGDSTKNSRSIRNWNQDSTALVLRP
jgi:hypothetical protein